MYPPTHISLPPLPDWSSDALFFTPPTSPAPAPPPSVYSTPPTSPFDDFPPSVEPPSAPFPTDDPFPPPSDFALDFAIDDDGLTTLEKIYLYSRSKAAFHRVFIAHALPDYLQTVSPQEALEYVLPLLSGLAMDDDEPVKEALAAELVSVIWWFFTHCQIIPDDQEAYASSSTTVTISVQAFTPILGTLLLSSNPLVGGAARYAVVDLLSRMKKADDRDRGAFRHRPPLSPGEMIHPWEIAKNNRDDDDETPIPTGMFGQHERAMFTQEILQQVVIGMGRLDVDYEPEQLPIEQPSVQVDSSNPYFPPTPSAIPQQSCVHYAPWFAAAALTEAPAVPARVLYPSTNALSPGTDFPPLSETSHSQLPMSPPERHISGTIGSQTSMLSPEAPLSSVNEDIWYEYAEGGDDEQAAVGRLSSMSLMAAVTASGALGGETQRAFVREVERVGHDPVYWVRREASFALGALAKVVPQEIVISSLFPLFDSLRWDAVWHVRHSALFALPAILARLSPAQRRTVALETMVTLSADSNETVRSGVLEALGEVIYTFHEDVDGPPEALVHLFLGPKGDPPRGEDRHDEDGQPFPPTPLELFYSNPKLPLICAFNFPAVALTLGGQRWGELREAYLNLTTNSTCGVRRTLAASLGELAKIIGADNTREDLLSVWWLYIAFEDEEVRTKAIEALHDIIGVVGIDIGRTLAQGLLTRWSGGTFQSWRERETVLKNMVSWVNLTGLGLAVLARELLVKGLEDNVAAVRDAAIVAIPEVWTIFSSQQEVIDDLGGSLRQLAASSNYRRRMTFIASQQALALGVDGNGQSLISHENPGFLHAVANLADDTIEGVRIGVARFAAAVHRNLVRQSHAIPSIISDLVHHLSQDPSHEVQSYVVDLTLRQRPATENNNSSINVKRSQTRLGQLAIFSRPPWPPVSVGITRSPEDASVGAMLVEEQSFSGEFASKSGGLSASLQPHDWNGNDFILDNPRGPGNLNRASGLPPPSFSVNAVCNTDERFGTAKERVTVSG